MNEIVNKAKKKATVKIVDTEKTENSSDAKIHLAKYKNIVDVELWKVAFVRTNHTREMHTKEEWDKIFAEELARTVK